MDRETRDRQRRLDEEERERQRRLDEMQHEVAKCTADSKHILAEAERITAQARLLAIQGETTVSRVRAKPEQGTDTPSTKRSRLDAPFLRNRYNLSREMLQRVLRATNMTGDAEPALVLRVYGAVHEWVSQHRETAKLDVLIEIVEAGRYAVYAWPKGRRNGFVDSPAEAQLWEFLQQSLQFLEWFGRIPICSGCLL